MADTKAVAFTPKRGRPTADQALVISQAITGAATELFLAEGFDGTTMDAVAARAGVPKSTIYKRFADKRALLRAVLEARVAGWSAANAPSNVQLTDDLAQRLAHYVTAIVERASTEEVQAFMALARSAWSGPANGRERFDVVGSTQMIDLLEHDIREFGPRAGVHAKDPRRVAVALMAMASGWLVLRSSGDPGVETDGAAFARDAVDLILRGAAAW